MAAQNDHEGRVVLLLKAGADQEQADPTNGTFPSPPAAWGSLEDLVALLLEA